MSISIIEVPDCTNQCNSDDHGEIITAAISKRSVSDIDLCAFLNHICCRCESVADYSGRTALHVAASCGRLDLVRWLVRSRHADIGAKDRESGYTALHRSIFYGKIDVAIELIKLGAPMNDLDLDNLTVLEHAMKDGLKPGLTGGELYSWGSNNNNLLGSQQARQMPDILDVFHKRYPKECVKQICIDQFHTVILTSSGKTYSCGHGQGGRLGLGDERTVITPHILNFQNSQKGESLHCLQASISRDHSIFLCSDGKVYTCGINTYRVLGQSPPPERVLVPKQIKNISKVIEGVCSGQFHSVAWGPEAIFTWGLNAGQIGHKINDKSKEQFVIFPKIANIGNDISITLVAASNGATAACTTKGDVYILHEYQCRKIASRLLNIVQISIVGGKLDSALLDKEISKEPNNELKVAVLTNTGNILLWQETDQQLCRCIYSLNRAIVVTQISINLNELLLVTAFGESFKGFIRPRKKKAGGIVEKPQKSQEKSAFHKFLEKEDCILIVLQKIPKIHRAVSIHSDIKGKDYCVIQAYPYKFYNFPVITKSQMKSDFQVLLEDADQSDDIHDVIFKIDNKYFPAHKYIIANHSRYLENLFSHENKEVITLKEVIPDIFQQFLKFIYTGECDLTKLGNVTDAGLRKLCFIDMKTEKRVEVIEELEIIPNDISAYEYYNKMHQKGGDKKKRQQNLKNPVRMLHELAKRFECGSLLKVLSNLDMDMDMILRKNCHCTEFSTEINFNRNSFPNLYDVTLKCKDERELKAHKCVLAARLEFFNNMFSTRWSGNQKAEVTLPFPKGTAEALLEFLYSDSLSYLENQNDTEYLLKVLILADQLFVTRLKEQCELLLSNLLTLKNAVQLLAFAHLYNANKLKYCCMRVIILNITPFLETHALDDLEVDLLKELSDFYCQEKEELWCRVITPYSTAWSDEEILSISSKFPVSLDEVAPAIPTRSSQKRKPRPHRTSAAEKEKNVSFSNDNDVSFDTIIQFPDVPEEIPPKQEPRDLPSRLKAISLASEKIKSEELEIGFVKLSSNSDRSLSSSFNEALDFPELNSPPSHGNTSFHPKTPPQRVDSRHKVVKLSQKQRKRLSSDDNSNQSPSEPESPRNPWKNVLSTSSPVASPDSNRTIEEIITDEKKQKENFVKITSKFLLFTQMEDKAIDELHKFYNTENVFDEIIVIGRVNIGAVAPPVWVPRTK